ncbi:Rieske 2Fe-2S domain-containing protein [Acidobacteriia bacterium AH_259_A11_L15]|nr:Rieske 2Fe-2S domain-containing protein [Acidobacteriia bacterium AH_259_A11_L15]
MTNSPPKDEGARNQPGEKTPAAAPNQATKAAPASDGGKDGKGKIEPLKMRRRIIWASIWGFIGINVLMMMRFFFPRILFEPKTKFIVGTVPDFGLGVDTRFQQQFRIWVVRKPDRVFVIYARCTHLGCTPDWKESESKFKCPCHGSGYDSDGVNFEGPAPRPMDRARVTMNPQGQIVVDTSKLFKCEKGKECEFDDPDAYIPV